MSPLDALVTATGNTAEAILLDDRLGTLTQGKLADAVVLKADPLKDISVLGRPEAVAMVFKDGQRQF